MDARWPRFVREGGMSPCEQVRCGHAPNVAKWAMAGCWPGTRGAFLIEAFLMGAMLLTSFGTALRNAGTWLLGL